MVRSHNIGADCCIHAEQLSATLMHDTHRIIAQEQIRAQEPRGDMSEFEWVAVALVVVMSSARLTRLWTFDAFPPVRAVREKFIDTLDAHKWTRSWAMLGYCPWCASFWITLAVVLSGYFSHWHPIWWIVNGSLGASYLAASYMVRDGDDSDEDDETDGINL